MTSRITSIILRGNVSSLVASMQAASSSVGDAAKRMTAANKEAATFRQGLTTVGDSAMKMGLVASAGLLLAGKAAMDWESAWAGVTKTVDGSTSQMAELEGGLRNLAKTLPATHSEIAAVAESAGQLGVAREDILSFTKTMIDLGETTNLTADEAATSIAQLQNVMGISGDDIDNLGSTLVALGNDGASTERDIIQMAQRIAGAAKTVGLSAGEVLAFSSTVASMGIEVEAGGTAVSTVLATMARAAANGGDKLESFASTAGMSAEDFATSFKEKPAEAMVSFIKGLEKTQKAGGNLYAQLDAVGLADIRVSQALIGMASSGDLLTDSLALQSEAWKTNTALSNEAEKRYGTTASQVRVAWNEMKDAAIDAGAALLPVAKTMASAVSSVASAFGGLPSPVQSGLTAVGGIAAVSLLVVGASAKMIQSVAATRLAMTQLGLTAGAAGKAMAIFAKSGAGLAAFWAGAALGDKVGERTSKDIDKMAASLAKLGKTGKASGDLADLFGEDLSGRTVRFGKNLGSIGDALKSLDGYADDSSLTEALKFLGSAGQSAGITAQAEGLMDLDKAFASLSRNKPDQAIAAFEKLRDRALDTGAGVDDVARAFPEMTELLRGASESMGGTSDASEILSGSLTDLAPAAQQSAEEIKAAQEALDQARESAMETSLSFFDFSRDAKQSFGDYLDQLEKSAAAYANFTENALQASANGLDGGLIDQLKEQGPEGALALADFADASEKEIARANRAFRDTTGLSVLQAELDLLPDDIVTQFKTAGAPNAIQTAAEVAAEYKMSPELVETILKAKDYTKADIKAVLARLAELNATTANPKIDVDTAGARGAISSLQQYINGMNGKTIKIAVERGTPGGITRYMGGTVPEGYASGGKVPGTPPSDPTRDNVLAMGATTGSILKVRSGEWIINQQQSEKNDKWLAAINAGLNIDDIITGYASGGRVSRLDILRQQQTVRDIERSLDEREEYGKNRKGKRRPTRPVLKKGSLDRRVALEELAAAKKELRDLKSGKAAKDEAREELASQRADRESNRLSAKSDFSSNFDIGSSMSTAAVDRKLERMIADSTTFVALLSDLKRKGASPWLLAQLVEAGPTPGAIRLARQYSTDSAALARVNAQARQIDSISNSYSQLVTNPAFSAPRAWNSGISPTVPAAPMTASLVGAEIAVGTDGLMRFVKGQIVMSQDSQQIDFRMATT